MLAMTAIAVTASICASAAEAALLVASFMPVSLDLGVTHRCAKRANDGLFLLGTPHDEYSLAWVPTQRISTAARSITIAAAF